MAMHPSENDFRFIVRVIAFALNACDELAFTRGLGADDEPKVPSLAGAESGKTGAHDNRSVYHLEADGAQSLVSRNIQLNCIIDDGVAYLSDDGNSVSVSVTALREKTNRQLKRCIVLLSAFVAWF